jgi:ArsR family transcriptional regulator
MASLSLVDCCAPITRPTLSEPEALDLERVFKALADRHRVRMVNMLAGADDDAVCVCVFCDELGLKQPTASYHLKQLVDAGLLEREPRGTFSYYRLAAGALDRIAALLAPRPAYAPST